MRPQLAFLVTVLAVAVSSLLAAPPGDKDQTSRKESGHYILVTVRGVLNTGIVAIGGETTGTTITANGVTFEVDLGDKTEWAEQADQQNGQTTEVKGFLHRRPGVEVKERWIIKVEAFGSGEIDPIEEEERAKPLRSLNR